MNRRKQPLTLAECAELREAEHIFMCSYKHVENCPTCWRKPMYCFKHGITHILETVNALRLRSNMQKKCILLWKDWNVKPEIDSFYATVVRYLLFKVFNLRRICRLSFKIDERRHIQHVSKFEKKLTVLEINWNNLADFNDQEEHLTTSILNDVIDQVSGKQLESIDFGSHSKFMDGAIIIKVMQCCQGLKFFRGARVAGKGDPFFLKCLCFGYPLKQVLNPCCKSIREFDLSFTDLDAETPTDDYYEGYYLLIKHMPKLQCLGQQFSLLGFIKYLIQNQKDDHLHYLKDNQLDFFNETNVTDEDIKLIIAKFLKIKTVILRNPEFWALSKLYHFDRLNSLEVLIDTQKCLFNFDNEIRKWGKLLHLKLSGMQTVNLSIIQKICPALLTMELDCEVLKVEEPLSKFVLLEVAQVRYEKFTGFNWLMLVHDVKTLRVSVDDEDVQKDLAAEFVRAITKTIFPNLKLLDVKTPKLNPGHIVSLMEHCESLTYIPQEESDEMNDFQSRLETENSVISLF